jgi:hypothetical protein
MASTNEEAIIELSTRFIADANRNALEWRKKMLGWVVEAARGLPSTYVLDPYMVKDVPPGKYSAAIATYLMPVVLSANINVFYDRLNRLLFNEGVVGLEKFRYRNTPGSGVTYMMEVVLDIFPIREEQVATTVVSKSNKGDVKFADPKYYLPLLYRLFEEHALKRDPRVIEVLIEMEEQWSKHMTSSAPLQVERKSAPRRKEGGSGGSSALRYKDLLLTSSSAALRDLGTSMESLPLPIECITDDLDAWDA